jgi:hypothetical protein
MIEEQAVIIWKTENLISADVSKITWSIPGEKMRLKISLISQQNIRLQRIVLTCHKMSLKDEVYLVRQSKA